MSPRRALTARNYKYSRNSSFRLIRLFATIGVSAKTRFQLKATFLRI